VEKAFKPHDPTVKTSLEESWLLLDQQYFEKGLKTHPDIKMCIGVAMPHSDFEGITHWLLRWSKVGDSIQALGVTADMLNTQTASVIDMQKEFAAGGTKDRIIIYGTPNVAWYLQLKPDKSYAGRLVVNGYVRRMVLHERLYIITDGNNTSPLTTAQRIRRIRPEADSFETDIYKEYKAKNKPTELQYISQFPEGYHALVEGRRFYVFMDEKPAPQDGCRLPYVIIVPNLPLQCEGVNLKPIQPIVTPTANRPSSASVVDAGDYRNAALNFAPIHPQV
jgi:hypothetical protein